MVNKQKLILAVETSCDDTSIAIMQGDKLLANCLASSLTKHQRYGGIVPEIASRDHCQQIDFVCQKALKKAHCKLSDIDYFTYTANPGLIGSLHIGKVFTNQLAFLCNKPVIKVNHLWGHIFSHFIDHDLKSLSFPCLSLVISGGHTFIAKITAIDKMEILNETKDDAVGEALDKIGRFLGFTYPGGKSIDDCYQDKQILKIINHAPAIAPFSFSGIKTACQNLNNSKNKHKRISKIVIASSALNWIVDDIVIKLKYYLKQFPKIKTVLLGGGASANKLLRKKLSQIQDITFCFPSLVYANDNAAMIALWAYMFINKDNLFNVSK